MLCLMGGLMGIFLGRSASLTLHWVLKWPIELSIPAIVAAVAVSAGVGVVFGYYPAWKASKLDPNRGAAVRVKGRRPVFALILRLQP